MGHESLLAKTKRVWRGSWGILTNGVLLPAIYIGPVPYVIAGIIFNENMRSGANDLLLAAFDELGTFDAVLPALFIAYFASKGLLETSMAPVRKRIRAALEV